MALITHNVAPGRIKKRLWWIRWSDVSRCPKAMQNHFLHPGHRKKRLGRSRLSDVLCRRLDLRTYNLLSECLKKRLWYSRWSDFSRSLTPCNLIFCILSIEKSDMDGLISDVLDRRMAQRTLNLSSRSLKKRLCWSRWSDGMRILFLYPEHRNKRLGQSRLSDVSRKRMALRTYNLSFRALKLRLW
jgi:hypothetical protein